MSAGRWGMVVDTVRDDGGCVGQCYLRGFYLQPHQPLPFCFFSWAPHCLSVLHSHILVVQPKLEGSAPHPQITLPLRSPSDLTQITTTTTPSQIMVRPKLEGFNEAVDFDDEELRKLFKVRFLEFEFQLGTRLPCSSCYPAS